MNSHQVGAAETSVLAMILYPLCNVRANCRWKKLLLLLLLLAAVLIYLSFGDGGFGWGG
jgi:hypothetical protein